MDVLLDRRGDSHSSTSPYINASECYSVGESFPPKAAPLSGCNIMRDVLLVTLFVTLLPVSSPHAQSSSQEELPDDYVPFTLLLTENELKGASAYLEGFMISMFASPEDFPDGLSVEAVLSHVRNEDVSGILTYPDGRTTEIEYEIAHHRGVEDIYMKSSLGYFLWEYMTVQDDTLTFAIYWWYCPPATKLDLEILEMAKRLLSNSRSWHQNDDRKCHDDIANSSWSLFCALKHASMEIVGEYNHRNAAVQTTRLVIEELLPNREFEHILEDFNNLPATNHEDVLRVLASAEDRIRQQLRESQILEK